VDSEKFDKVVLDLLYDDLDELTRASAVRHMEQSARAKALYTELRATREVGALPLVEPPPDLEDRILAAEAAARASRPLGHRLGTLVSVIASYAMRPQLAMAALLLLMVGSSLLFLRVSPGETSAVQVTERGVPESDKESVSVVPAPAAAAPAGPEMAEPAPPRPAGRTHAADAPARAEAPADEAAKAPPPQHEAEDDRIAAKKSADFAPEPPAAAGAAGPPAALSGSGLGAAAREGKSEANAATSAGGCTALVPHYEDVAAHDPSSAARDAARFALAECYAELGQIGRARTAYTTLLDVAAYAERARKALANLPEPVAAPPARAAAPAEPAKPAAPAGGAEQ
jgi:hypothetical protein